MSSSASGPSVGNCFGEVQRGVDVAFPHFARQFVQQLDAVAVRIVDVEAVGHAVLDAAVELHATLLQIGELAQPRLAVSAYAMAMWLIAHGMPCMDHSAGGGGRFGFSIRATSWWFIAPPP